MSRSYTIGLLLGLCKKAVEEEGDLLGGVVFNPPEGGNLPRRPKHPEKMIKAPRRITSRKRRRFVRQRKLPKKLLSA
jgi:hypothetical protein